MNKILLEAGRLHSLGFAVIPLLPKSKRPKENKWTSGPRKTWEEFLVSYKEGDNIGVRLGEPSKIGDFYLACIDVDVKNPAYQNRAKTLLEELIGQVKCPQVISGSGNGSSHYYCLTRTPFKMITIDKSSDGEICVYSTGRQMVVAPSIHPSGSAYKWASPLESEWEVPLIDFGEVKEAVKSSEPIKDKEPFKFKVMPVDAGWLPLKSEIAQGILVGSGVEDKSAFLLTAARALMNCELERDEILSVLTNPDYFISRCGAKRRGTDRESQAEWVWNFTLKKLWDAKTFEGMFGVIGELDKKLTGEALENQTKELSEERNWRQDLKRTGKGEDGGPPISNIVNVVLILENVVSPKIVKRNEFAYRDTYGCDTPWGAKENQIMSDDDDTKIKYWLGQTFKFEPKKDIIGDALTIIACKNAYDPVKNYLNSLPPWDRVPRLDTWLSKNFEAKGSPEYLAQVFKKWMVAMVIRVFHPGTKFDWMPIFEGPQGIGKSSFGRILVGNDYFLDWLPNLADKDSALALQGMWGVEMGELANMRKNELEVVKGYITRTTDKVRPPFGKRWIESHRRCVFFGTTNKETYLSDDSGNRRFKPVQVGKLNFEKLAEEKDFLFSEAIYLYENFIETEKTLELTEKAKDYEIKIQAKKMIEDDSQVMYDLIQDFLEKVDQEKASFNLSKFSLSDLFEIGTPLQKWVHNRRNEMFASKALRKLGFGNKPINGRNYWFKDENDNKTTTKVSTFESEVSQKK